MWFRDMGCYILPTPVLQDPTATVVGRRRTPPTKESRRSPSSPLPSRRSATSMSPCPHELARCHPEGPLELVGETLSPVGRRSIAPPASACTRRGDRAQRACSAGTSGQNGCWAGPTTPRAAQHCAGVFFIFL
jgi:hypothetical protein